MPSSSSKIVQSTDGRFIIAAGTYPPRIRCYDVHELTMKFERYLDAHILDMVLLGEDYGKMALLQDDRTIAFHAPYGSHESIRIPTFGRGMAYEPTTCELLLAAKGNRVYRVNLDEGRFSEPWTFEPSSVSSTCVSVGPTHPIAALGGEDGVVRFWDNRSPDTLLNPFLKLDVRSAIEGRGYADEFHPNPTEISCISYDQRGMHMGVGTAGGVVALYDVRSSKPLHVMEHKGGTKIHTIKFHESGNVLSGDEQLIKIWRYKAGTETFKANTGSSSLSVGSVVANVEGSGKLSHFILAGDESDPGGNKSGLLLCATDQPKMETYYIPSLGLAPKWCSFLENITEELEERDLTRTSGASDANQHVQDGQETIYENYKFVSREELEKLGISNLVGTPLLRGYMHGFFIDTNLYNRVRAVANPFEYEEYRKKKLRERLEAKRASRIAPKQTDSKKAHVNPNLAARLEAKAEDHTKAGKVAHQVLSDERFGSLFTNPDYHVDEEDENFKLRNPSGVAASKRRKNDLDSDEEDEGETEGDYDDPRRKQNAGFNLVEDENDDASDLDDADSDSDEDGFQGGKVRGEMYEEMKLMGKKQRKEKMEWQRKKPKAGKKSSKTIMYEADDVVDTENVGMELGMGDSKAKSRIASRSEELKMPLHERLARQEAENTTVSETMTTMFVKGEGATREVTYIPKSVKKRNEAERNRTESSKRQRGRRGIKELGFKTPFKNDG